MVVAVVKNVLMAKDMDRAVAFYSEIFDFEEKMIGEDWSELMWGSEGDSVIALHGGHDGSEVRSSLSIEVDDIEEAVDLIMEHNGKIVMKPEHRDGEPIILGEFKDPEGNIVMLTQYVGEE